MKTLLAGLIVGGLWLLGPVAQAQELRPEIKSGYIRTSDQVRLHYLEAGSGPAIVFVPGWTCPTWVWEPQIRHFSKQYRVVALDPRSQGESEQVTEGHYPERRAQDIKELIEQLRLEPAVVVGHSLAVWELLAYVDRFGTDTLAGVVLVDNSINPQGSELAFLAKEVSMNRRQLLERMTREFFKQPQPPEYYRRLIEDSMKTPTNTALALLAGVLGRDFVPMLGKLDKPVLYAITPPLKPEGELLLAKAPKAQVEVFENSGHTLFVDEAGRFDRLLEEFARTAFGREEARAQEVRVNGVELAYVEQGSGEPVVLLHGFLHDYRVWSEQWPELSKRFRVIAYSRRYRWPNRLTGDGSDVSQSTDEADLVEFIRTLKLGRVHLVGHSAGGRLALRVARDHPELVRSLVLGEAGTGELVARDPEAKPLFTPALVEQIRQAYEGGDKEAALNLLTEAIVGEKRSAERLPAFARNMAMDNIWQMERLWARGDPEPGLTCEDFRRIKAPTLLIEGEHTLRLFHLMTRELHKCMPGSEHASLPQATHGLELENPAGFNEMVLKFLTRHSGPAPAEGPVAHPLHLPGGAERQPQGPSPRQVWAQDDKLGGLGGNACAAVRRTGP